MVHAGGGWQQLANTTLAAVNASTSTSTPSTSSMAVSEAGADLHLWNGATATISIFGVFSLLFHACALALPRMVDGPRRSALLQAGPRSDAQEGA